MAEAFTHPYLPGTEEQRNEMLRAVGVTEVGDLFTDIPASHRDPELQLPPPLSELELRAELEALARRNAAPGEYACFLGAGAYRHFIPAVVRAVTSRGELLTSYTPYQPEVSQGTLQATYEFQSLICLLTGMDVTNAGMYDGASALAEAALMACRVTGRARVMILDTVNPGYRRVVATYLKTQGIEISECPVGQTEITDETACLIIQNPNFFGYLEDHASLERTVHEKGALLVVVTNPITLGLLKPPGEYGADIVVGECQPLGIPLSFGGPYVGFFSCKQEYLRQLPGRIVGRSVDTEGRTGYVLTLQAREQHIRRGRATSNICTSEALVATAVAVYLAALGAQGMRKVAELCYHKAHFLASQIAAIPGYSLPLDGVFFNEFVVQCPISPREVNRYLLKRQTIGGLDISDQLTNGMLLCTTELNTRAELDSLVKALGEISNKK